MATFVRAANPIWFLVDLQAKAFDDTFYLYTLENTLPYIPSPVYHDPNGAIPWTDPIQFLANGTLPVDVYWDPALVYRLEFRQNVGPLPPSQSDPLIYLVENFVPGTGGNVPVNVTGPFTENQMSNPQFAEINFTSPFTRTGLVTTPATPIPVAPGWDLLLNGTGNVTITREALTSATIIPTNAPYALRLQLTGWTDPPILRQRFQQAGTLWANKYVASSVTARAAATATISARLINSMGATIATVLSATLGVVSTSFNEFTDFALLGASTNTDTPPAAWIDYQLLLPTSVDITLTSFQLIASDTATRFSYEQDTIDRQLDHTFHYFKDSILLQPKDSLLTGWDFGVNPWQINIKTGVTPAINSYIGADQTVLIQQNYVQNNIGSNVSFSQATAANNLALTITAVTADNQFGLLQYIDPRSCAPYWLSKLSSLVRLKIATTHSSTIRFKMRLIASSTVPAATSRTYPVASWVAGQDPAFDAAFTVLTPINDPVYTAETILANFSFNRFDLTGVTVSATTQTLGIFIYTIDNMDETATADALLFESVSLVPNDFAIGSNTKTFDETLRDCEYYYEKTMDIDGVNAFFTNGVFTGAITIPLSVTDLRAVSTGPLYWQFRTVKRAAPTIQVYAPSSNVVGSVDIIYYVGGAPTVAPANFTAIWTQQTANQKYIQCISPSVAAFATIGAGLNYFAYAQFQATMDARIGV